MGWGFSRPSGHLTPIDEKADGDKAMAATDGIPKRPCPRPIAGIVADAVAFGEVQVQMAQPRPPRAIGQGGHERRHVGASQPIEPDEVPHAPLKNHRTVCVYVRACPVQPACQTKNIQP